MSYSDDLDEQLFQASNQEGEDERVLELLQSGANPNSRHKPDQYGSNDWSPLHAACRGGHHLSVEYLLKWGAQVDATDSITWLPLHWASENNHLLCVTLLLEHYSPTDVKSRYDETPEDLARQSGYNDIVELITNFKSTPRDPLSSYPSVEQMSELSTDKWFQLGLHLGLSEDQLEDLKNSPHPTKATLLAAKTNNIDLKWKNIVEGLLHVGEYKLAEMVCMQQGQGHTALSVSAFYGWLDIVKNMVDTVGLGLKESLSSSDENPLYLACVNGHLEIADHLIAKNICDVDDSLSMACANGHLDAVKYLVEVHHCDPRSTVNKAGQTTLFLAYSNRHLETIKYLVQEQQCDPNFLVSKDGVTPLSLECSHGNLEWVKALINEHIDPNSTVNKAGETPLSLACAKGHLDTVRYLVDTLHCNPRRKVNKTGQTTLFLAYSNRHLETVKYLVQEQQCDPNFPVNKKGDTPFSLECSHGNLEWVKALINKHVDPNKPASKHSSDTPITLAYKEGHGKVVKYFAIIHHCDTKDILLNAIKKDEVQSAKFLLEECQANPNVTDKNGKTPLNLTNHPDIVTFLLKHGAKADNVYKSHSKILGKLSSERPPDNAVHIFITGDSGVGKSAILKSMLSSKGFKANFLKAEPVTRVDEKTVGIYIYELVTKEFGRVVIHDFAGQQEFYTSHCAVLEHSVQTSPPIIIYVAHLQGNKQEITDSTAWWMTLVHNQCTNLTDKAHVIVVGSHADKVTESGENPRAKESIFASILKKFPKMKFIAFTPMDCRVPDSDSMKEVKKQIQQSSATLRSPETVSLNTHTFYIYILEIFKDDIAVTLRKVLRRIHSDLNESQSKRIQNILSFIPTTLPRLVEICVQLNRKGLILFLHNEASPEKSFIVCDRVTLLSRIIGVVFAPENCNQHCKLASSAGIVKFAKFAAEFHEFNCEMLVALMSHLKLCSEITDKEVLDCVRRFDENPDTKNRYLFFPGLIRTDKPERFWENDSSMNYHFGWIVQTSHDTVFFDPRCLQVLILRLVFTFGLAPAPRIQSDNSSLQRYCFVWKDGIFWINETGITFHLELTDNRKSFVVRIRSADLHLNLLIERSKIINTVLETVATFCPYVNTIESVINPIEVVQDPLRSSPNLELLCVKDVATAVCMGKDVVKSKDRVLPLKNLLQFEPHVGLDIDTLQCIHSDKNVMKDEKISTAFVSHLSNQIIESNSTDSLSRKSTTSQFASSLERKHHLIKTIETWRDKTEGTYTCLRETFNNYSIFTGRNLLSLAGVAHEKIDPSSIIPEPQMHPQDPLRMDTHLQTLTEAVWEVRTEWFDLGVELGVGIGDLKAIQHDHPQDAGACLTSLLETWLTQAPTWTTLIEALQSTVVNRRDIASNIEHLISN